MKLKRITRGRGLIMLCGWMLSICLTACSAGGDNRQAGNSLGISASAEAGSSGQAEGTSLQLSQEAFSGKSPDLKEGENETDSEETKTMKMNVQVGDNTFIASLEENAAVDALVELMENAPVVVQMYDYSGFEKVGPLGTSLPADNSQTTTQSGDIVLYNGNQIVIFYGSNSWSYTRLGKIDDLTGWEDALGGGDVTVTFSAG